MLMVLLMIIDGIINNTFFFSHGGTRIMYVYEVDVYNNVNERNASCYTLVNSKLCGTLR